MTSFLAEMSRRDPVLWVTGLIHLALAAVFVVAGSERRQELTVVVGGLERRHRFEPRVLGLEGGSLRRPPREG